MWIVMHRSAKMPNSVKSPYRRVAVVKITDDLATAGLEPKMISTHARGVLQVRDLGKHHVGRTARSGYQRTLVEAAAIAAELNADDALALAEAAGESEQDI